MTVSSNAKDARVDAMRTMAVTSMIASQHNTVRQYTQISQQFKEMLMLNINIELLMDNY